MGLARAMQFTPEIILVALCRPEGASDTGKLATASSGVPCQLNWQAVREATAHKGSPVWEPEATVPHPALSYYIFPTTTIVRIRQRQSWQPTKRCPHSMNCQIFMNIRVVLGASGAMMMSLEQ